MAARIEPLITVDDLDSMPEDGNRYEVIEGELFVSRAPGVPHQRVLKNAVVAFDNYLGDNPIGEVIPTPGLIFGRYSGVIPDIVFYMHEVARDRIVKRQLYAKYGVAEYWIVDAENRAVEVYRLQNGTLELAVIFRYEDEITTPLLSGFKCSVARIFR